MITVFSRKRASSLALAVALATGSAVVATAIFPTEASAQRRKKSENGGYSAEFRAVYDPIKEASSDPAADLSSLRPQLLQLNALLGTNDEKLAGGSLIYEVAARMQDKELQLMGMENMLASTMVPIEQTGLYNFIAYQLANGMGDVMKARTYLQAAINYNFTTETVTAPALQITLAENYWASEEYEEGFAAFDSAITQQKATGQPVDEQWYRRGLQVAYNNDLEDRTYDVAIRWLKDYTSDFSWRETINITRNLNEYTGPEILDVLRLARLVNALQEEADFEYYVEAADPRRLPQEVSDVIKEGEAAGIVSPGNLFLTEALENATGRIAADRADLPELERDASAPDAGLRTVVAAADTLLNYGDYAKAVSFYERALTMEGVDADKENTRLGIAQVAAGNYDAAREAFSKVSGNRTSIARLWLAYIDIQTEEDKPSLQDLLG